MMDKQPVKRIIVLLVVILFSGVLLAFGLSYAMTSSISFFGSGVDEFGVWVGAACVFMGYLLPGLYFKPNWRGIFSGICTFAFMLGLVYRVDYYVNLTHANAVVWDDNLPLFLTILFAAPITILLVASGKVKTRTDFAGLGLGLIIGGLLSFGIMATNLLSGVEQALVAIPGLWLSAVFFPELLSGRTDWRGILVWLATMAVPFVFIPLLRW